MSATSRSDTTPWTFIAVSLVMLAILAGSVFYLADRQGVFEPRLTLHFRAVETYGLAAGVPVTYAGYRVGSLDELQLTAQGDISASLSVLGRYQHLFTQGSVLTLNKGKIISTELAMVVKTPGQPALSNGSAIAFDPGSDTEALAREFTDRFTPLINNVTRLTAQLADERAGVAQMLHTANAAAVSGQQALAALQARIADPRIDASYDSLAGTLKHAEVASAQLSLTLQSANALVKTTQTTVEQQNAQLREALLQVNQVLQDVRQVSQAASTTVDEVRDSMAYRVLVGKPTAAPNVAHESGLSLAPAPALALPPEMAGN